MSLFAKLYDMVMVWARHRNAPWYLAGLSFSESSFFPIPPDVMLAPMALARPNKAWRYAWITTISSVLGGIFGYLIGMFAYEFIEPLLQESHHWEKYSAVQGWFEQWGFWAIFIAGFSPIPYKLFTIAAGTLGMMFIPFVLASFIGRGARFFLVACLMVWGGERMEKSVRQYIDKIGWIVIVLCAVLVFISR